MQFVKMQKVHYARLHRLRELKTNWERRNRMIEMMLFTAAVLLACVAVWVKRWCDRRNAEKAEFVKVLNQARWAMITSKRVEE